MSIFKKAQEEQSDRFSAKTRRKVDKRNKSLKTISITSTIIFLVILLAVNVLFDNFLGKILKWDWTPSQMYSVGEVSNEILKNMTKDVQIVGLFDEQTDAAYADIREMLEEYARKSGGRVTLRYVDPVKYPSILKEVDPSDIMQPAAGTFVVFCPETGKAKNVKDSDLYQTEFDYNTYQSYVTGVTAEQSFTGAIKYVQSEETPVVYFTTGHGELDYESEYSILVTVMKNNNFEVKELDTFNAAEIPADCQTLIIADPDKDISTGESIMIHKYLKSGGGMMVITDFSNSAFPVLNQMLADFNLEISGDKVREGNTDYRLNNDPYYIRANAPASKITPQTVERFTLIDNARSILELKNTKEYIKVEPILTTSNQGVVETGGDAAKSSEPGTQTVGFISENSGSVNGSTVKEAARVMLLGSSSIFQNATISLSENLYNIYMFYFGIQWLTNTTGEESLYIAPKTPTSYSTAIGTTSQKIFTAVLVIGILPGLLLLAALIIFRKRKHL